MRLLLFALVPTLAACASAAPKSGPPSPPVPEPVEDVGILVMAHGGASEWNEAVTEAVAPLAAEIPTAVAYGMANPVTLAASLDSLHARGVRRVAVVRMFLSGESFAEQTEFYLGMSDRPPETFVLMGHAAQNPGAREPLRHPMSVATHQDGLLDSDEARRIAMERALGLSSEPSTESVLFIAHGMGDEDENDRVLVAMAGAAASVRPSGFAAVEVATLREDWEAERAVAEEHIRRFVTDQTKLGRSVIVVPIRLSGFGPYAEVLEGLEYVAAEGLLPHPAVGEWVRRTATSVTCSAGWGPVVDACPTRVAVPASPR